MKQNGISRLLTFIMATFLLVFTGYHVYRPFFSDYSTENVYRYTVYHSTIAKGVFFREEKSLEQTEGNNLRYAVQDGEKVRVGSVLAYRYSDALSADLAEQRAEAEKELTMLQRVLNQLNSSNTPVVSDLTRNTDIALQKLAAAVALEHYDELDKLALGLQEEINLSSGITGGTATIERRIAELSVKTENADSGEAVFSTQEGYFSSMTDGQEGSMTPARLESMDCDELMALLSADNPEDNGFGKIVSGPEWYFALTISSRDHKSYPAGSSVLLSFPGGGAAQGTIMRTELSDDGSSMMLVIKGNTVTADTVSRRVATVRLSSESYTGVRFDKEYLRIVDGAKGVYVDNGYSVKFKTVDIIYEGDTYYLSRLNYTGERELNIFDKLVNSKNELYDGMPLSDL